MLAALDSGVSSLRRRAARGATGASPESEVAFRTGVASEITGISQDRLQGWHQRGLLAPSVAGPEVRPPRLGVAGRRPGSAGRRYSLDDLFLALVIRELLASSVRVERVRLAVEALKAACPDRPLRQALRGTRLWLVVPRSGAVRLMARPGASNGGEDRPQAVVALSRTARAGRELWLEWQRRRRTRAGDRAGRRRRARESDLEAQRLPAEPEWAGNSRRPRCAPRPPAFHTPGTETAGSASPAPRPSP